MRLIHAFATAALMAVHYSAHAAITVYTDETTFKNALTGETVVNFDDRPNGSVLGGSEYSPQGLTISQLDGRPLNIVGAPAFDAGYINSTFASASNALSSSYRNTLGDGYVSACCGVKYNDAYTDNFKFSFGPNGAAASGLWYGELEPHATALTFYDASDNVLHSVTLGGSPTTGFYGITSDVSIAYMVYFNRNFDVDGTIVDDVVYKLNPAAPVPEPESYALLLAGLGLVGAAVRCKKRRES